MIPRSLLFVPADSEKKLAKGLGSGADALILDLEDSVSLERKPVARDMAAAFLAENRGGEGPALWVRVNPLAQGGLDDLVAIVRAAPAGLIVPKPDGPSDLLSLGLMLDALERRDGIAAPIPLIPIATETPTAVLSLGDYAQVPVPRLAAITWGAEDLAAALGARANRGPDGALDLTYRLARSSCLLAAKAAGVAAIDTVWTDFSDAAGFAADCAAAAREGFSGRMAIHPNQVAVINAAFTPSAEEVAHAREVVAAFAAAPGAGVVNLGGRMFDVPHLKQARALIAQAEAFAARG
ncbi:HpcH/HpaI aldolase/citrate lyase family protein [Mesorhizobium australicum]|uniref:Citrate lyase subunit beta / citryl-CoA lyase n=1 Tax=Mesorhizobium australicum TaxID=536018 RepID=A0A1X7N438_9HYPH|nr:CoA ester lyase [Mesorhizobium australicum]SMH32090.1 citrate lyase subunit beta / citryl-CoA lyase [Mesorhizobium australicum]